MKTEMDVAHHLKVCDSVTSFRKTCKLLKESGHIHLVLLDSGLVPGHAQYTPVIMSDSDCHIRRH